MIRHIVMFQFKEEVEGQTKSLNIRKAKQMLQKLVTKINVIVSLEIGINNEQANINNYDLVLIADFNTLDDLEYYQKHHDHQEVVSFIKKVVKSRACVDYKI